MRALPKGSSNFSDLRMNNKIYVDKTDLIYSLANQSDRFFLSRPRRFGKSLLVSTFESLFRYGIRDFKGLAIEPLWTDKTYTTISLDFSCMRACSTIERFREMFLLELKKKFHLSDVDFHQKPSDVFGSFLDNQAQCGEKIVLLIDEYDSPLSTHIDEPEFFDAVLQELDAFYAQMKANDGVFRFVFITGIAKFGKASVFSMLNHVTDISQDPRYGTLLGYTDDEIRENFADHLKEAARILNTDVGTVLDTMRTHYDGFCFEESAQKHIYTPWSVLQFLANPAVGYKNYWADSAGKPTVLIEYLRRNQFLKLENFNGTLMSSWERLSQLNTLETLHPETLFFQTGYLSIVDINKLGKPILGTPNQEIRDTMDQIFASALFTKSDRLTDLVSDILNAFDTKDAEALFKLFKYIFADIAYDDYPFVNEASVRAGVQLLLIGAGMEPAVEKHTPFGRTDLQFTYEGTLWIFEFKFRHTNSQRAEVVLREAEEQILNRHYGEEVHEDKRVRLAIVFDEEIRNFACWKKV